MSAIAANHQEIFLTIAEAADLLRISPRTAYELARRGDLPTVRVGGSYRVPRERLATWLNVSLEDA